LLKSGDTDRVAALMRETAAAELTSRFRNLAKDDIKLKRPGDVVTVADVASEQRLASGLARILPGVPVVGEEAVEKDPGLLDLVGRPDGACWIVDPLDGTANFAAGKATFAMIIALVRNAETVAGFILDVPGDRLAVAVKSEGVTLDGAPVRGKEMDRPTGYVGYRFKKDFDRQLPAERRRQIGRIGTLGCAGHEYLNILDGRAGFSIYRITKPWDHAAGALMLREAGGEAVQFGGAPYVPGQPVNAGLIGAADPTVLAHVRSVFEAARLPLLAPLTLSS
jgi:fructose-1,6-bisphosphatase/inositol monophosphatase family enzyme